MATLMALKHAQFDTPAVKAIYLDLVQVADWEADDPRLPAFADRFVSLIEESAKDWQDYDSAGEFALDDDLLDAAFLNALPIAARLLELLEERGWTGWTRLERIDRATR